MFERTGTGLALGKPLSNYATSTSQNTVSSKFYNDIKIINFLCNDKNDPLIACRQEQRIQNCWR